MTFPFKKIVDFRFRKELRGGLQRTNIFDNISKNYVSSSAWVIFSGKRFIRKLCVLKLYFGTNLQLSWPGDTSLVISLMAGISNPITNRNRQPVVATI